jgi:predicted alpha/beta superfamily hydrolase
MFLLILLCISASICFGQSHSFYAKPDTINIDSKIFNSARKFTISVPKDIDKLKKPKNCIVYVDGDNDEISGTILQTTNNLYLSDDIPQSILIGIFHENRDEELVEKTQLLNFILTEVLPVIQSKYLIENELTILGHSFGGYFSTYCFFQRNDIFRNCVAISPAYWANEKDIYKLLNLETSKHQQISGNLFIAIGDKRWDDISLIEGVQTLKNIIEKKTNKFNYTIEKLIGFNHNSTPTVGFALGLNYCYDTWEWNGIVEEQNTRITAFPDFWRHYELKANALEKLNRKREAIETYEIAISKLVNDPEVTKSDKKKFSKILNQKIKKI